MSLPHTQLPVPSNATDRSPATWEQIMVRRYNTCDPSYIPLESVPPHIRHWYPFEGEVSPPGFVGGPQSGFHQDGYDTLVRERTARAAAWTAQTGVFHVYSLDNGRMLHSMVPQGVVLPMYEIRGEERAPAPARLTLPSPPQTAPLSRPSSRKRKRSPEARGEASPSSSEDDDGYVWVPSHDMNDLYPSEENIALMSSLPWGPAISSPGFGLPFGGRLSFGSGLASQFGRQQISRAPSPASGPDVLSPLRRMRGNTGDVAPRYPRQQGRTRQDSTGILEPARRTSQGQEPQQQAQRSTRPPVPEFPWDGSGADK